MAFQPVSDTPVEEPDAPAAAAPQAKPGAGFVPADEVPVDLTPDELANDPTFEPYVAANQRRAIVQQQMLAGKEGPDYDAALKQFDVTLGADPAYNLFQQAHKKRIEKLATTKDYKPELHYSELGTDFSPRGATVKVGGRDVDENDFRSAQRAIAAQVYAYRARNFGDPHAYQKKTDWGKVGHGVKEQAKDVFGLAGATRGMGYLLDDTAYMGRGAAGAATGDTSSVAKADLASREVQSGLLSGAMNIINLGYGLRDWWQGDDVAQMTDAQLQERFEDEVKRKITVPAQLTPENLEPILPGAMPYKAVLAEAGGAAEAPKADLEWMRFGAPKDEQGNEIPDVRTDAAKRAGDIATRLEFSAYGKLMGLPGYRHVAKALAGGAAKYGGAAVEGIGNMAGKLIDSKVGRGATLAGAGAAAIGGNPLAAAGTYVGARLARIGSWLAQKTGAGVREMGDEILAGKPLTAGSRLGRTAMEGGKAALESGVAATPFVLAAETPEDAISTALGLTLQGGAGKVAHEAVFGSARNKGAAQQLAQLGASLETETGFDDAHAATTAGLKPEARDTVNAIRGLLSRFKAPDGSPLQMFAIDGQTFEGVLREAYPGASEADIADAARARGWFSGGNQVFVNAGVGGDVAQPAAHEGGHLVKRALEALDAQTRDSAKAAVSAALYDENGQPDPAFMDFVAGYNKKAPKAGQLDVSTPEGLLRAEDEFIAEHFRNLTNKRPGLEGLGALVTGDSLANRMVDAYDNWAKTNGIRTPDRMSEFNWTEVPEFTKRFNEVLRGAFKDAHEKGEPEPAAAEVARRNAKRMSEIDQMSPGELTPEVLSEYDALRKENAEIGRKLAQIGPKGGPAAPTVATSPAGPKPPTSPTAAASNPTEAAIRKDVELALNQVGIKGKEARDLAAQAQGADASAMFADALSKRTSGKTPPPRAPATVTSSPARVVQPVATPAAPTAPPPATSPVPVAVAPRVSTAAPIPGPGGRQILAGTIAPEHPTAQRAPALAAAPPAEPPVTPRAPALANLPKAPEGLGKPGALAPSHETKTQEPTGKLDRTADDDAAEALIAEAPDKTQAALDLVTQAAGGDPALLQKRTDPLTGKVSYSGRLDFSKPEHRTLIRSLGLTEQDIAKLQTAQGAGGDVRYVDYWSASKEDAADITGKQRKRELAADKDKKSRELMQKNKAIIFTGVTVWPSGKAVQKGISVDKFIANAGKLLEAAKAAKLPVDYKDVNDPQLVADLQGYIANHKANVKGDGSGPVAGKEMTPGYDPYLIPRNRFDLLNAAFNIDISAAKSGHAAKVAADEARRAAGEKVRKRPALRPETELKAEDAQRVALENGWQVDDATGDTNPFRAMMNKEGRLTHTNEAGETRKGTGEVLESVFENLSPDMIEAVRTAPEGERSIVREVGYTGEPGEPFKKGLPDWGNVAAGFMPGEGEAASKPIPQEEIKGAAAKLGVEYNGATEFADLAFHVFNDTKSVPGKNLSFTIEGDVTPEKISAGRARKLKELGEAGAGFMPGEKDTPEEFYSPLERIAKEKIKGRATAEQIEATLRNNGVKQEELDWVLGDFLRAKAGQKIEPAELAEQIQANAVQVNEKQLNKTSLPWTEKERGEVYSTLAYSSRRLLESLRSAAYEKQWDDVINILQQAGDEAENRGRVSDAQYLNEAADKVAIWQDGDGGKHKFSQYQLPGGTNYRELLFTLPRKPYPTAWREWSQKNDPNYPTISEENEAAFRRATGRHRDDQFSSGHFDEPNILFHARVNDRTTTNGSDILFAEEIQSDWHQAGRKKGYKGTERGEKHTARQAEDGMWEVLNSRGEVTDAPFDTQAEADRTAARLSEDQETDGVPNAPFKGEGWKRLALKQLLAQAVKAGKSALGWTTGEQQAARYDLSKQVERIDWVKSEATGNIGISAEKDRQQVAAGTHDPGKLADVIGKELADKVAKSVAAGETRGSFSGLDLKIGGEGMKGFYDKELVNIANDLGKKYGAKVAPGKVSTSKPGDVVLLFKRGRNEGEIWYGENEMDEPVVYPSREAALKDAESEGFEDDVEVIPARHAKPASAWVFPITPELRAAVEAGQSLFMPPTKDASSQQTKKPKQGALAAFGADSDDDRKRRKKPVFAP